MSSDEIFEMVKEKVLEILDDLPESAVTREKSLRDLGANSIDRVDVITESMEDLEISIPIKAFADLKNIGELVDLLHKTKTGA